MAGLSEPFAVNVEHFNLFRQLMTKRWATSADAHTCTCTCMTGGGMPVPQLQAIASQVFCPLQSSLRAAQF